MKKNIFLFPILLLMFIGITSCEKTERVDHGYLLKGDIQGIPDGVITIKSLSQEILDSITVKDGHFVSSKPIDKAKLYLLVLSEEKKIAMPIALDTTEIIITGNINNVDSIEVKGSAPHDLFIKMREISSSSSSNEEMLNKFLSIAKDNPTSYVVFEIIMQSPKDMNADQINEVINLFKPSFSDDERFAYLKSYSNLLPGNPAPEFSIPMVNGKNISIADYKGKYLLIDFWASWCGPCRRVNPSVLKLYNKYKNKSFDILGISLDKDRDEWIKAIAEDSLVWNQASNIKYWNEPVAKLYLVNSIPHSILIDPNGNIVGSFRIEELTEKLEELLK